MRDTGRRVSEKVREGGRGLAETADDAMAQARDYGAAASERASEVYHRSGDAVRSAGWRARDAAGSAGDFAREHPLAVGLVVAAAGAVIAGLTPRSRREDELHGRAQRRVEGSPRATPLTPKLIVFATPRLQRCVPAARKPAAPG